jgi:hypothetical protein
MRIQTMNRMKILTVVGALVLPMLWSIQSGSLSQAQAQTPAPERQPTPNWADNYYVQPTPSSLGATMYPCPRPTPPMVGHTYVTYQPWNPQEFMYRHRRIYSNPHEDGPKTTTYVHWW